MDDEDVLFARIFYYDRFCKFYSNSLLQRDCFDLTFVSDFLDIDAATVFASSNFRLHRGTIANVGDERGGGISGCAVIDSHFGTSR